jgi:AraC-like DNA-binding protein
MKKPRELKVGRTSAELLLVHGEPVRQHDIPTAPILHWSALEIRLHRIADACTRGRETCENCGGRHTRAWLIGCGSVEVASAAPPVCVNAGHWLVATPGCGVDGFSRDARALLVCFDAEWPGGKNLFQEAASRSFPAARYPQLEAAALRLLEYVRKHLPEKTADVADAVTDLHVFMGLKEKLDRWVEAFAFAMASDGAEPAGFGANDPRLERAVHLLDAWPLEMTLDREHLAHEAGVALAHLEKLFHAQLHLTPSRYLDGRRIRHAFQRLCETQLTIKEVACGLGFQSQAHFSHWFHQHEHISPRGFRQAHAG